MSPLDDSLRDALRRQAQSISGDPMSTDAIAERVRRIQRRRGAIGVAGSALAAAVVAVIVVFSTQISHKASAPPAVQPNPVVTQSVEPTPSPSPPMGCRSACVYPHPTSSLEKWGFRGDRPLFDRSIDKARAAYQTYRSAIVDPANSQNFAPIFAGVLANASGDVITYLDISPERTERAVTVVLSEGGTSVVADQPVADNTVLVDALLPADPARIILAIGPPATGQISYRVDKDTTPEQFTNGIAQFGRSLESKGGTSDGVVIYPDGDGLIRFERTPGVFDTDPSQPGRMSDPNSVAQWVFTSWISHDLTTAKVHATDAAAAALFALTPDSALIPVACERTGPMAYTCNFSSREGKAIQLDVGGTPSLGFTVTAASEHVP